MRLEDHRRSVTEQSDGIGRRKKDLESEFGIKKKAVVEDMTIGYICKYSLLEIHFRKQVLPDSLKRLGCDLFFVEIEESRCIAVAFHRSHQRRCGQGKDKKKQHYFNGNSHIHKYISLGEL